MKIFLNFQKRFFLHVQGVAKWSTKVCTIVEVGFFTENDVFQLRLRNKNCYMISTTY